MVFAGRISTGLAGRGAALVVLLACAGLGFGCATRSPAHQEFVELRTRNFHLTSSLPAEQTLEFARRLEYFHAGVLALLGLEDEATPPAPLVPTPVFLFDDRSLGRPFAVQNEAAYLIDAVEAPIFVFRGARDFSARATPDLRHRYAHRVLRDRAREQTPLWYEEGVAQLARTLEDIDGGVRVGRVDADLAETLLDWRREDLLSVLKRSDVSDDTRLQRERFEAEAWGIAHALEFSGSESTGGDSLLDRYRKALDSREVAVRENPFDAIGLSPRALETRIDRHLEARRTRVVELEPRGYDPRRVATSPIPLAESRARLGELALSIDRPALAAELFELALEADPSHLRARLGSATASARHGGNVSFESLLEALELPPDAPDPAKLAAADAARAIARATSSPTVRSQALTIARERYAAVLAGPTPSARAQMGMALTYLEIEGEDAARSAEWIEAARATRAGSLVIELRLAEAEAKVGALRSAQVRARNVISRTHDLELVRAARALLVRTGADRR